jgi:hypothetical protein
MSSNFVEDEKKDFSKQSGKKNLRKILNSYMKQQNLDQKSIEKMKKEFLNIKNNMNEAKTSYETLMDIQKKLCKVYKKLNKKDDAHTKS